MTTPGRDVDVIGCAGGAKLHKGGKSDHEVFGGRGSGVSQGQNHYKYTEAAWLSENVL